MTKGILEDREIKQLLQSVPVGHLALCSDNLPYLIPLNYLYSEGKIYFHSRVSGRKVDYIAANQKACFQVGIYDGIIMSDSPCNLGYTYKSVIIEGKIQEVIEPKEKEKALVKLTYKYAGSGFSHGKMAPASIEGVKVFCLAPESISGKKNS